MRLKPTPLFSAYNECSHLRKRGVLNNPNTKKPLRSARQSFTVLKNAFKQIGGYGLFVGYGVFLIACCALLCLLEPETFPTFGNAIWYAFQAITTIGFGDIVAHSTACRAITILIGLSSLVVVALITGTVVNYYNEMMRLRRNDTIMAFDEHMRKLTELSPDELRELEESYRAFTKNHRD